MNSPPKPIEVSTYAGHAERSGAMQAQLRDILARVDSSDIVANAIASLEQARTLAQHLKQAQVRLMRRMQDLSRTLGDTQRASEDLIIAGEEPDLAALGQCEAQHRLITRAHQRIVERLLPEAEIGERRRQHRIWRRRLKAFAQRRRRELRRRRN